MILQAINFKQKKSHGAVNLITADKYRRNATICTHAGIVWFISFILAIFLFVAPFWEFINFIDQNFVIFHESVVLRILIPSLIFIGSLFLIFRSSLLLVMKYLEKKKTHCLNCGALPSGKERVEAVIRSGNCWHCNQPIVKAIEK